MQMPYVSQIPVPFAKDKRGIESRVEQILAAKQADPTADVSTLEREIDELVYALYGLTPAEIALVEGREALQVHSQVRSNRFSGEETAEAVTTNTTNTNLFTGRPPQGSFSERLKRVQALIKQASPAAIQDLVAALGDENETIVWTASAGLRKLGATAEAVTTSQVIGVLQVFVEQTKNEKAKVEAGKILQALS